MLKLAEHGERFVEGVRGFELVFEKLALEIWPLKFDLSQHVRLFVVCGLSYFVRLSVGRGALRAVVVCTCRVAVSGDDVSLSLSLVINSSGSLSDRTCRRGLITAFLSLSK